MAVLEIQCKACKLTIREIVKIGHYSTAEVLQKYNWSRGVLINGYLCPRCQLPKVEAVEAEDNNY